tara:strand:- start:5 stop:1045 length:1041 start_codon:yes stop_codon:yes gene_type:complete
MKKLLIILVALMWCNVGFAENIFQDIIVEIKSKKFETDKALDKIINDYETKIKIKSEKYLENTNPINFIENIYKGEVKENNLPHGIGNILYQSEDMYMGEFFETLRHGVGRYTYLGSMNYKDHPFSIGYYIGEWYADANEGLGESLITKWENLSIYRGNWAVNRINGFGYYHMLGHENNKIPKIELIGYFVNDQGFKYIIEIHRKENGQIEDYPPSGLYEYDVAQGTKTPIYEFKSIEEWDNTKISKNKSYPILEKLVEPYLNNDTKQKKFKDAKLEFAILLSKLQIYASDYGYDAPNILLEWIWKVNELREEGFAFSSLSDVKNGTQRTKELEKEFEDIKKKLNL